MPVAGSRNYTFSMTIANAHSFCLENRKKIWKLKFKRVVDNLWLVKSGFIVDSYVCECITLKKETFIALRRFVFNETVSTSHSSFLTCAIQIHSTSIYHTQKYFQSSSSSSKICVYTWCWWMLPKIDGRWFNIWEKEENK